ncbi:MAG: NAD-binding protein [Actinomycetota bacterium]|nr:NAD-binding protein [Actinomycetota bacterium]
MNGTTRGSELGGRVRWAFGGLVAIFIFGVIGYMMLEDWTFLDALYMTVITLTTVGFSEVRPLDSNGRVFTIVLLVMGVGLALVSVSLIAQLVAESQLGVRSRRRRMERDIDRLRDHTIICAYGRVGRAVARELRANDRSFVVIDPQEDLRERMETDGVPFLIDDPSNEAVLRRAGVDRARSLVCAVDSDATNVYITLIARSIRPDLRIVARASEPGSAVRLEHAGADRVVSPFVTSGRHMAKMAMRPELVDVLGEEEGGPALAVEERSIEHGSTFAERTVADAGSPVLAVRHGDGEVVTNPPGDLVLREGDTVLVLAIGARMADST